MQHKAVSTLLMELMEGAALILVPPRAAPGREPALPRGRNMGRRSLTANAARHARCLEVSVS